jgi:hypothetical protein
MHKEHELKHFKLISCGVTIIVNVTLFYGSVGLYVVMFTNIVYKLYCYSQIMDL